jgi:hypothetical protein
MENKKDKFYLIRRELDFKLNECRNMCKTIGILGRHTRIRGYYVSFDFTKIKKIEVCKECGKEVDK